ncbi:MAG: site-specific DNA-methyltransferase [Ruminococcus flavefaciens]|nr:site-specific DNA-methyltransferase [Ruminococcus flavefaciens]
MANLSQIKREKMLAFLETLKEQRDDDESLIAINQIEKELTSKKYGLVWEEHEEEVDVKMQTHIPVFAEVKEKEIVGDSDNDECDFLLEGDNLHSLKLLEKTHKGKIDVIYIDPPYNRGNNDFRYDDICIDKIDAFKHSKWLSFMVERMRIAWKLLSNTGAIFVSIDDYEMAALRMLCDEVFGEINFLCNVVWQKRYSRENREAIGDAHEYIIVYVKDKQYFKAHRHLIEMNEKQAKVYKNPNNDPRGRWRPVPMTAQAGHATKDQFYPIMDPKGNIHYPPEGRCWGISQKTYEEMLIEGRIYFGKNNNSQPNLIRYLSEVEGVAPWTWWNNEEVGHTDEAKKELYSIVGKKNNFETPKPVRLINRILKIATENDAIILDFFAGSGTTGQAVMELNQEDGGNRHFILCTNNENNICEEVTYQRLKTVITGKRQDGSTYSDGLPANLKYYKTDFVAKDSDDIYDDLLEHIEEMIQLQYGIKIDKQKYVIIMDDDEMDEFERNFAQYDKLQVLFINQDVLLSSSQEKLLDNVNTYIIPDCYFDFELREAGELW